MEKIKIRGLARIAAFIFCLCGSAVFLKAIYDISIGEPEANLYAPYPWAFVAQAQWLRYAGFELCYGLACLGLSLALWRYARFLPEFRSRPRREPEFKLFD